MSTRRALTVRNVLDSRNEPLPLEGVWADVFGRQDFGGAWLIYGREKNGKTTFALMFARALSQREVVLYISAEENPGSSNFQRTMKRAGVTVADRNLRFLPYMDFKDIAATLHKRRAPRIVFLDNLTKYRRKVRPELLTDLLDEFPKTTFVFLGHENPKDGEPLGALAFECKIFGAMVIRVEGLVAKVVGRGDAAGELVIDEEKASLYYRNVLKNPEPERQEFTGTLIQ